MIYLANPSTPTVRAAINAGWLGCLATPAQGNRIRPGWTWAMDNGCFSEAWQAGKWIAALERNAEHVAGCLFAVVPDAVADAAETGRRWEIWSPVVAELGYPRAYVLQDGCERVPWDDIACLFVGGSTEYKMSDDAYRWTVEARRRGKWVHWGRVNSRRRFAATALTGDSADGTYLAFGPDVNLPRLRSWVNTLGLEAS
jgi:hypothetical protein